MESINIHPAKRFALRHTAFELAYFRRLFIFIKRENTFLKQRISDALQDAGDAFISSELEHFKIKVSDYDAMIFIACADIAVLANALKKTTDSNEGTPDVIIKEAEKIRKALLPVSKNFILLNSHLNKFLTDKS